MKKTPFDLDAECNFSDLPREQTEGACKYEYMRESGGLRGLYDQAEPSIAPYQRKLSRSCTRDCPREYKLQQNKKEPKQYRFYCSHCDHAVNVPPITIVRWKWQLGKEHRSSARRVRPSFVDEFGWEATLRLVVAFRNAGFPNPWKALSKSARNELIQAISGWDAKQKKIYPPVTIQPALERDLKREQHEAARFPILRIKSFERELRRLQSTRRKYFCGLIWIDEAYNETDAGKAFRNEFRKLWPKTKGGGRPNWPSRLNQLAVMRIWNRERNPWKRLKLVAEFCGYKGCRDEVAAYRERCKQGRGDEQMGKAAQVEMSNARAEARAFFQSLFKGEEPLSYRLS